MSAQRGIARERALRRQLDEDGWWTARSAGSFGDADIIAARPGPILSKLMLIEIKSTSAGPYHAFGPDKRKALSAAAALSGGDAWLVWWPPRSKPKWFAESDWPVDRRQLAVVGS